MKKILYSLIALMLAGGAYIFTFSSGGSLFPDTTEFARMPKSPGTLGYVLELLCPNFISGCRTPDSKMLGGIPAYQYVKIKNCANPGATVWRSIDQFGNPECKDKTAQLALWQATVSKFAGTMQVFSPGMPPRTITTDELTRVVKEGDIIQTSANSSGTITFSDASVLRLDADTTVELSTHTNTAGESIAAIILADGQLWGRVLTSSGMDFGAGGYIAGVRGTSILVSKPKNSDQVTIAIVDSTNPIAATITNTNNPAKPYITVDAGSKVVEQSGATIAPTEEISITKASLLAESTWAKKNTLADIDYLTEKKDSNIETDRIKKRAKDEVTQTLPKSDNPAESTAICDDGKVFWESLVGKKENGNDNENKKQYRDKCQDPAVLAFADFTKKGDGTLYLRDGTPITPTKTWEDEDEGAKIEDKSYIQYDYTNLAGRTVEIELNELPNDNSTRLLLSMSTNLGVYRFQGKWQCKLNSGTPHECLGNEIYINNNKISIYIPATISSLTQFKLGNNSNNTSPLDKKIKSITIR